MHGAIPVALNVPGEHGCAHAPAQHAQITMKNESAFRTVRGMAGLQGAPQSEQPLANHKSPRNASPNPHPAQNPHGGLASGRAGARYGHPATHALRYPNRSSISTLPSRL